MRDSQDYNKMFPFLKVLNINVVHRAYNKTSALEVKLIRFICVLALAVSGDFSVSVSVLANDLNIKQNMYRLDYFLIFVIFDAHYRIILLIS